MANQRITDLLLPNDYQDGEILYGSELRKIVSIIKSASNADIEELQAMFADSVASNVVHYDVDPNRDVEGYLLDYSDFGALYDAGLTEGDSIFVFIDTLGGTRTVDESNPAFYEFTTDGGTYETSTFTLVYDNFSIGGTRDVIETYKSNLDNTDSSLANRISALEALTNQEVLDTSDVDFNDVDVANDVSADTVTVGTSLSAPTADLTTLTLAGKTISYNTDDETFDIPVNGAVLQLGQELHFHARANEAITNGDVVMFVGVQGGKVYIESADETGRPAELQAFPQAFMGIATSNIAKNEYGHVTWFGMVRGIAQPAGETWVEGDLLYVSPTTGKLTNVAPGLTDVTIQAAVVVEIHTTSDIDILVRPEIIENDLLDSEGKVAEEYLSANIARVEDLFDGGVFKTALIPGAFAKTVEGYFNSADNLFYEEATFTTPLVGDTEDIYVDLGDETDIYKFTGTIWVSTHGTASETAMTGTDGLLNGATNVQAALELIDNFTYSTVGAEPANSNIQEHIGITSGNPHGTTYSDVGAEPANANIQEHISSSLNPHSVTKTQVGLGNVTNDAQVKKASSATESWLVQWDNSDGDTIGDAYEVEVTSLGNDSKIPLSSVIKTYVDTQVSEVSTNLMIDKFVVDNTANPPVGTAYTFTVGTAFYADSNAWELSVQYLDGTERTFYPTADEITEGTPVEGKTADLIVDLGTALTDGDEIYIKYLLGAGITLTNVDADYVVFDPTGQDVMTATNVQEALIQLANSGASVAISETAPTGASDGDLWYDSVTGNLFIRYSSSWIDTNTLSSVFYKQDTEPMNVNDNDYWLDTTEYVLYVYDADVPGFIAVSFENNANEIAYDNTSSGMIAEDVQAAIDEVEGIKAEKETFSATLLTTATWIDQTGYFTTTVSVSGLLDEDIHIGLDFTGITDRAQKATMQEELAQILDITTSADTLTFEAIEEPVFTYDMPFMIEVIR